MDKINSLDKQYTDLLQDILDNGVVKGDRTGTGTISVFGRQIRHKMSDGFPLLTTKKMPWKPIVTELLWFLRGDTNIKYLVENGCNIWNGDAYKNYEKAFNNGSTGGLSPMIKGAPDEIIPNDLFIEMIKNSRDLGSDEFAKKWGDLGPIYGKQWRNWGGYFSQDHQKMNGQQGINIKGVDQLLNSIDMLKNDPDSRRNIVSAWNVDELKNMKLPPCHNFFQFYTRELDSDERLEIWYKTNEEQTGVRGMWECDYIHDYEGHQKLDTFNIPKRAISLMWNQRSVNDKSAA